MIEVRSDAISTSLEPLAGLASPSVLLEHLKPYLNQALDLLKGATREKMPVGATGNLSRGVFTKIAEMDGDIGGYVYVPSGIKPGKYAYFVEFGRQPGKMPPWDKGSSLYEWVKVKITSGNFAKTEKVQKVTSRTYLGKQKGSGKSVFLNEENDLAKEIRSVSYLVARAIARKGTKAQHPFDLAWAAAYPEAMTVLEFGIQATLMKLTGEAVNA
jgi:hypothetical protein